MDSMPLTLRAARRVLVRPSRRTRICLLVIAAYAVWLHVLLALAGALGASLASAAV
jgi:hypothetical protein